MASEVEGVRASLEQMSLGETPTTYEQMRELDGSTSDEQLQEMVRPYLSRMSDGHGCTTGAEAHAAFVRRVTGGAVNLEFTAEEHECHTYDKKKKWKETYWHAPIPPGWISCCFNHDDMGGPGVACTDFHSPHMAIGGGHGCKFPLKGYLESVDPSDYPPEGEDANGDPLWTTDPYYPFLVYQFLFLPISFLPFVHRIVELDNNDKEYESLRLPGETREQYSGRIHPRPHWCK